MNIIETNNLTKVYRNKTVVNEINLKVKKGIIFGFLGHNGAGKSTFINILTGLCKPTKGDFKLKVKKKNDIGVLPDYSSFYDNMTGKKHIKYFCKVLNINISSEEIERLFQMIGLENGLDLKVKKYSFGMKKKLGIIQAIINKPKILFLDEPTSGVDANSILSIHNLIKEIAQTGTTVFITSHNLDEIQKLCDEIAIMKKGNLEIKGNLEELRQNYENSLSLEIRHNKLNDKQKIMINQKLESFSQYIKNIDVKDSRTYIKIKEKSIIPEIVKIYVYLNINVYKVDLEELSLEDIFLRSS